MAKNAPTDELPVVNEGHVYKANKDGREVIPFHIDRHMGRVRFAGLGSSRETEVSIDEFLEDFSYVGLQSASAEKPSSAKRASDKS